VQILVKSDHINRSHTFITFALQREDRVTVLFNMKSCQSVRPVNIDELNQILA